MNIADFSEMAAEIDKESVEWLEQNHPTVLRAMEKIVARGKTPDELRAFVHKYCGYYRGEFAVRCEQAARYLERSK